jgi:Protein of unknown function (DUF664)
VAEAVARNPLACFGCYGKHGAMTKPQHRADMFPDLDKDPREGGTSLGDADEVFAVPAADPAGQVRGPGRGAARPTLGRAVHMIEEYARHNGHADLLRERIDGRLGQ